MTDFDVGKEKGGMFYVFSTQQPDKPLAGTYRKDKKDALHIAADLSRVPYKDFLKLRKNN